MDIHTVKFGLGVATAVIAGMVLLFVLYAQMGAARQKEKVAFEPKERQK